MTTPSISLIRNLASPRVGVSVLATTGGRVLLGKRLKEPNQGTWVLPGGGIRLYESIEDTARRELLEEAGARIRIRQLFTVSEVIRPGEEHRIILFFFADLLTPERELRGGDDLDHPKLFTRKQLLRLPVSPVVRQVLECADWLQLQAAGQ